MLLRTRITLMVSFSTVVVALVLFGEGRMREDQAFERYQSVLVTGDRNAWFGGQTSALDRLANHADEMMRDDRMTRAVADRDRAALSATLAELVGRVQAAGESIEASIFSPDARLQYDTGGVEGDDMPTDIVATVAQRGQSLRGLIPIGGGGFALAVATPLYSRSGVSGVLMVRSSLTPLVAAMSSVTDASVSLVDPTGREVVSHSSNYDSPTHTKLELPKGKERGVLTRDVAGRFLSIDWFVLDDAMSRPALRLAAARDITDSYRRTQLVSALSLGAMLCGGALFLAMLHWYMRRSFRPLNVVIRVLNALARGETEVPAVAAAGRDEIGRLAGTLEQFRQAQKARDQLAVISQDIDAASRIQSSFLPRDFPSTSAYRVHAVMRPARNVGGDFYDFFDLPEGRFGFVIADVSGKGMGAAMFMAMARTVIRSVALVGYDPGVCLARANDFLCASQMEGGTFVTVFYGILDPASGKVAYANGGHNPPYVVRQGVGAVEVPGTGGLALGVMEGVTYAVGELTLEHADHLFLFTDGVTEAMTTAGEQFTEERLERLLAGIERPNAEALIESAIGAVDAFAGKAPQADDITCLAIEFA
jgi:sigma-B regulation protein RsbU (phosphoserine phosphatase)